MISNFLRAIALPAKLILFTLVLTQGNLCDLDMGTNLTQYWHCFHGKGLFMFVHKGAGSFVVLRLDYNKSDWIIKKLL